MSLPSLGQLLSIYRVQAAKNLSQNFLFNSKQLGLIASSLGPLSDDSRLVVEIGPGPGSLTRALLAATQAKNVLAIEKDSRFDPILQQLADAYKGRLRVVIGDALEMDQLSLPSDLQRHDRLSIFGNLPFAVASPILIKLIDLIDASRLEGGRDCAIIHGGLEEVQMALMFQKEVAQRILAPPGSSNYCRLSLLSQLYFEVRPGPVIPSQFFFPKPKVDGQLVLFRLLPRGGDVMMIGRRQFQPLLSRLFASRKRQVSGILGDYGEGLFVEADIPPNIRPIHLSPEAFLRLAASFLKNTIKK